MKRPDILYAAHLLVKISGNPYPVYQKGTRKKLQYLWRTDDIKLPYGGDPRGNTKVLVLVNTDYMVMMGNGATSLFSHAQKVTATAPLESEYIVLFEMVNELRFLHQMKELMAPSVDGSMKIHDDNE